QVVAGGTVIEPSLVRELLNAPTNPMNRLTTRERDVLMLVAEGRTDRGIAEQLYVTRKTVEAHVRSILRKLDLPTDATENRRVPAVLTCRRCPGRPDPDPRSGASRRSPDITHPIRAAGAGDHFRIDGSTTGPKAPTS